MTWDEYYCRWSEVRCKSGQDVHLRMQEARKRVAENTPDDWCWLEAALTDANRKWFVALLFKFQPVPRRFVVPLLRAAVLERNPTGTLLALHAKRWTAIWRRRTNKSVRPSAMTWRVFEPFSKGSLTVSSQSLRAVDWQFFAVPHATA